MSLTLAPFYGLPIPAAQAAEASTENAFSQAQRLLMDMDALLDRALYPDVPRANPTGLPTASELNQIQIRIGTLHASYQANLQTRIAAITDAKQESDLVVELNSYFTAVQRLEGLKIVMSLPVQNEKWDELYSLRVNVDSLSQMDFIATAAAYSDSYVELPGTLLDLSRLAVLRATMDGFTTRIDNGVLSFRLNPGFAESYERLAMTTNLGTRNVLLYAIQWTAHRLYDSQGLTLELQRQQPMTSLPEPSATIRQRFVSMRLKRAQVLQRAKAPVHRAMKSEMLKAILDALDAAHAKNEGWVIDESFIKAFSAAAVAPENNLLANLEMARRGEQRSFILALVGLLNLSEITDWNTQGAYFVREAVRLAIRSSFLINPDEHFALKPQARDAFEKLIEDKAKTVSDQILSCGLGASLSTLAGKDWNALTRDRTRQAFQENLLNAAHKMQTFATSEINLAYLIDSQRGAIDLLKPSAFVSSMVDAIEAQTSYTGAHNVYRNQLYTFMQAFSFPNELVPAITQLDAAATLAANAHWNPESLKGKLDDAYLSALNAGAAAREKDLKDLIRIGQILKFPEYEKYVALPRGKRHGVVKTVTPNSVGMEETLLGSLLGSDKQAYLESMKKDLLKSAPILGGTADSLGGQIVWEALNRTDLDADAKYRLVDAQLAKVMTQTRQNSAGADQQLAALNAANDDSLKGANEELRTLITRAAQLSVGLNSFAGFDSYYQEVRGELLLPDFAGREWQNFVSWSNTASTYLMMFWVFKTIVGPRVAAAGRVMDILGKLTAPIFGTDFARLNLILLGTIGVTLAGKAVDTYQELSREKTLRNFFECGSGAPCVALYTDVAVQAQRAAKVRNELILTAAIMIGVFLGIKYLAPAAGKILARSLDKREELLLPFRRRLGLESEESSLSRDTIDKAAAAQIAKARTQANPLMRAADEALIKHARKQIELAVLEESAYWAKLDARFADTARELGLDGTATNWKDMSDLANAWGRLYANFKAGRVSSFRYEQLMQSIVDMRQVLNPVYAQMSKPFARNFMTRVWDGSVTSQVPNQVCKNQINASQAYFKSLNLGADFQKAIDAFTGTASSAATAQTDAQAAQLIEKVSADLEKNPGLATSRLQNFIKLLRLKGGK